MELKVLMMAFERLSDEQEKLKSEVAQLREELKKVRSQQQPSMPISIQPTPKEDELMNLKQVQAFLGICYNSLKKLIEKGKIKPIRINERRVRFSRLAILNYVQTEADKP